MAESERFVPQVTMVAEGIISYPPEMGIPPQTFTMRTSNLTLIVATGTIGEPQQPADTGDVDDV